MGTEQSFLPRGGAVLAAEPQTRPAVMMEEQGQSNQHNSFPNQPRTRLLRTDCISAHQHSNESLIACRAFNQGKEKEHAPATYPSPSPLASLQSICCLESTLCSAQLDIHPTLSCPGISQPKGLAQALQKAGCLGFTPCSPRAQHGAPCNRDSP